MSERIVEHVVRMRVNDEGLLVVRGDDKETGMREEIVRCRDCKHGRVVENEGEADGKVYKAECATCSAMGAREWPYREFSVDPDGFCAWGERKA